MEQMFGFRLQYNYLSESRSKDETEQAASRNRSLLNLMKRIRIQAYISGIATLWPSSWPLPFKLSPPLRIISSTHAEASTSPSDWISHAVAHAHALGCRRESSCRGLSKGKWCGLGLSKATGDSRTESKCRLCLDLLGCSEGERLIATGQAKGSSSVIERLIGRSKRSQL
jgi:hypothetical protein